MKKTRKSQQASPGSKQISFLPEPDFNPEFPKKHTLAYAALLMMLKGNCISHPDFEGKTDSWRLAAHIHELIKLGWPVNSFDVELRATKKPKSRRICRYYLSQDIIEKINQGGGVYA